MKISLAILTTYSWLCCTLHCQFEYYFIFKMDYDSLPSYLLLLSNCHMFFWTFSSPNSLITLSNSMLSTKEPNWRKALILTNHPLPYSFILLPSIFGSFETIETMSSITSVWLILSPWFFVLLDLNLIKVKE